MLNVLYPNGCVGSTILFFFESNADLQKVNFEIYTWNTSQAAFLSTLAGVDVAEAAARAAVTSLSQVGHGANREHLGTLARNTKLQGISHSDQELCLNHSGFGFTWLHWAGIGLKGFQKLLPN